MPVAELGREAGGVAGDGGLAGEVQPPAGHRADVDRKAQPGPECVPEGQQLVKVEAQGDADGAPLAGHRLVGGQQLLLVGVEVEGVVLALAGDGLVAAVARNVLAAVGKGVDGQLAVVAAGAALDADHLLAEGLQLLLVHHGGAALPRLAAAAQAEQGCAVGAHQAGDVGADDLHPHLLFKGAQDGLVVEGAALDHDLAAQLFGAGGADDLVQGVFDHADGQAGADVLDAGAVLLGLLDRAVHKDGAAAAQVHRAVGKQAQRGKLLDVVAQRLGKGLQEAAAARRTGLVQKDVADGPVLDLEALHVLAADVDDEIHVGHEILGGGEVGHRLHQAVIAAEGVFDQVLAVAGGGHAGHLQAGVAAVDLQQLVPDQGQRVAQVGLVVGVEDAALLVHHHQLDGGGARVDADVDRPALGPEGDAGHAVGHMPGVERLVLLPAGKEGRFAGIGGGGGVAVQGRGHLGQAERLVGVEGRAQRHVQQAVLGALAGDPQRLVKALAQHRAEGQRPAQIQDVALDGAALGQAGDGLADHRLVDAGGDVLGPGALVDEGLHVALGEHAAAGGDGVGALGALRRTVHLVGAHLQQGGHLVDEGAGAAGAAAVHPHLGAAGEEEDLGVLASQLDHAVGLRHEPFDCHPGGENFLHKGHAAAFGQAHARRAGNAQQRLGAVEILAVDPAQQLLRLFQNMAVMTLIGRIQQVFLFIQHGAFDGRAANIKTNSQVLILLQGNGPAGPQDAAESAPALSHSAQKALLHVAPASSGERSSLFAVPDTP